ncbi:hypothetical protein [Hyalangium rubrum]|uniref:Lipoprotein n=1 Tax=Hyalangium rubrum TaxID=3103134 RepID=A0ABU5GVG4_9BACT|nr:hypothetical protein [Hyalangium sp. s54d21]MDY7225165.1 hypothetical protein [Hyalangium sp. s54d21]
MEWAHSRCDVGLRRRRTQRAFELNEAGDAAKDCAATKAELCKEQQDLANAAVKKAASLGIKIPASA